MSAYRRSMSIRRLFALFLALSVLLAPSLTSAAGASPISHDLQMMEGGHCNSLPSNSGHHDRTDGKSCCISMCMGVAITPAEAPIDREVQLVPAVFAISNLHLAYLGEIATPPPRGT